VRSDEEVGQDVRPRAAGFSIGDKRLASQKQRRPGNFQQFQLQARDGVVDFLRALERQRKLGIDNCVDRELMDLRLRPKLCDGSYGPLRIILQDVDQYVRIDQDHPSSRNMRIRSSVRHLTVAVPRADSNRSFPRRDEAAPAGTRITCPSPLTEKSTALPGRSRNASRMCLGMVTCPLLVNVVDMSRSRYYRSCYSNTRAPRRNCLDLHRASDVVVRSLDCLSNSTLPAARRTRGFLSNYLFLLCFPGGEGVLVKPRKIAALQGIVDRIRRWIRHQNFRSGIMCRVRDADPTLRALRRQWASAP
jgi:hypothetical protein